MPILYFISGSLQSKAAQDVLKSSQVRFKGVDASEARLLAALHRDLCIDELPTLVDGGSVYVGLDQIQSFADSQQSR